MTLAEGLAAAAARAAGVAAVAWLCAIPVEGALRSARPATRTVLALALAALLITPTLITAYAWSALAVAVAPGAVVAGLHVLLLAAKLIPVAVVALLFAPAPPLGPTARFALGLAPAGSELGRERWRRWWWCVALGPGRRHLLAAIAVFLCAFGDFELSSLLMQPSWTVWLFDAQAGGMPLGESLACGLAPLAVEAVVIACGFALVWRGGAGREAAAPALTARGWPAHVVLGCALALAAVVPGAYVLRDTFTGIETVLSDGAVLRELSVSVLLAGATAVVVLALADAAVSAARRRWWIAAVACLPGLFGSLLVALAVQALFQVPGLAWLYDTPLPMLLGSVLWLLPLGVVLAAALETAAPRSEVHVARLLRQRGLALQRRAAGSMLSALLGRRRLWVAGILFAAAYFEVVASAILAPVALTPASVRLYNLMHYGNSAILSAMVALMVGLWFVAAGAVLAGRRVLLRVAHG